MWDELRNPIFLFSETFATSMQTEFPGHSLDEIPRLLSPTCQTVDRLPHRTCRQPGLGMALAYLSGDHSMRRVAHELAVITPRSIGLPKNLSQSILVNAILKDLMLCACAI